MTTRAAGGVTIDPAAAVEWYGRNRRRSRALFDLIDPAAYYTRPISLRNPIVFYEGHLPAFSLIAFVERGLGRPPLDAPLESLFARGIDPDSVDAAVPRSGAGTRWPTRDEVLAFGARADHEVFDAIGQAAAIEPDGPRVVEGLHTALEHEAMHQETLLYMWHRLPYDQKHRPEGAVVEAGSAPPPGGVVRIPAGVVTVGADRRQAVFGWDNEFEAHRVEVPAFDVDVHNVTNADFLAFVEAGGYGTRSLWSDADWAWIEHEHVEHPAFWARASTASGQAPSAGSGREGWRWRGMFEAVPLPLAWPVYVSQAEASAYARWKGRRLMTEAEYHRAAFGTPSGQERRFPWGDAPFDVTRAHADFAGWDPVPVGSRPAGASAWGVHDLMGNGWEWTSTVFAPFAGFAPMASYPEYSADFFDGQHYVMKGASPATARELLRPSFRNWFRSNYPYVYAKFRTVR